ncbi:MAG: amidase family protein [Roseovarius sp.]|nr:amidase family protein [Roseovarius sp.]
MNIDALSMMTLQELQDGFANRSITPLEVMQLTFQQIEAVNGPLNALYDLRKDAALAEAEGATKRWASGRQTGPLDGVPVSIKDSVNAVGMRWHHGSALHGEGIVARADAPPVKRLRAAGAIIVGKGVMPDFGLSGSGVSGSHGIVRNPWGRAWNTGGSSAGAGASLAAGIGMMSVGSDIAGSVRLPASHCGLAALKPTQGAIAHAPASTVRSAGPMTRRAADLRAWTQALAGLDDDDRYSLTLDPAKRLEGSYAVGASADFGFGPDVEDAVMDVFADVRAALAEVAGDVRDVTTRADFDAYLPIDDALKLKGWSEHNAAPPELRVHTPGELLDWFSEAGDWNAARTLEIASGIERGVAFCRALMEGVDFLLTPVMPLVNFAAERRGPDPAMPLRHTTFTAPFNQSGHPAVTICGGFDARGLPVGAQLVGHRLDDYRLLDLAARLEAHLDLFGQTKAHWPTTPRH